MLVVFIKMKHFFTKMRDILLTDLCYLLPCFLQWFYHRKIKKDVFRFQLKNPQSDMTADLYQHGEWNLEKQELQSVLILHGQYSHPCVMLHLAKIAQTTNIGSVFSLHVRYDDTYSHRSLIKQAMDSIEKDCLDKGHNLSGIILVGHSMGAIEAAYFGFVTNSKKVSSVISIAGRLKDVESITSPCKESLKGTLYEINKGIQLNPHLPLYQIVGLHDWNASLESTIIRKSEGYYHIVEDAMHFNILFHKEVSNKLVEFLQESIYTQVTGAGSI